MAPIAQSAHTPPTLVEDPKSTKNASVGALDVTKAGKPLKIRSYPEFESLEEERLYRKQHLAAAYRVFAERGTSTGLEAS